MAMRRKVIAGAAAALAVGGAGAGVAATKLADSRSAESQAIVNDAAKSLGVEPSKLEAALKKAFEDRIDAAVADGRLTKEQGQELKKRIEAGDFPLFGAPAFGPGFGTPHPFFHGLDAAASYLGLTEEQLESRLESGKTLAQIAKAEDKSVDGLKAAMLKDAKTKLDALVKEGKVTKADEQKVLKDLEQRVDDLVNGQLRMRFREDRGFGFRHDFDRDGPPAAPSGDSLGPAA
jgi:polyhydroxyalkanoate synthesis regulator phasin